MRLAVEMGVGAGVEAVVAAAGGEVAALLKIIGCHHLFCITTN